MPFVYAGQYLRIDLDSGDVRAEPISDADVRTFFLGSGYAAKLYAEEMNPETGPLDPGNPVYVFNGLLAGTFAPTGCRSSWCGRSPLTGIWNEANMGGHFGAELRAAGVDGLVITGRAEQPVYLYIHDGMVEIRDASDLWGLDTFDAYDRLLDETDAKARAAVIGPAGENGVHFASVMQGGRSHSRAAGRGGIGALLGSKNVKGIVARGRERPDYADKEKFSALVRELTPKIREGSKGMSMYGTAGGMSGTEFAGDLPIHNWQDGSWEEGAQAISGQTLHEEYWVKHTNCHACPIGCGKEVEVPEGKYASPRGEGVEYETLAGFAGSCHISNLEAVILANSLCNRYGLDTISTSATIAFAMEAFENGLIDLEDTGGLELRFGDPDAMLSLVEQIAFRRGLGDLLAEGAREAARRIGGNAGHYAIHVKGLEVAFHDPRAFVSMAVNYATAVRGGCHLEAASYWNGYGVHLPDLGYPETLDRLASSAEQAKMAYDWQNYAGLFNPLGLCKFIIKGKVGAERLSAILNSALGWNWGKDELLTTSERIFQLKRLINLRLGITAADDRLPTRFVAEPRPTGSAAGNLPDMELMMPVYYELRGWDEHGVPSPERLAQLGLA